MTQEPLPNPQGEWEDALRRIELESLKSEQEALIAEGLNNLQAQQNYRELSSRITRLIGGNRGQQSPLNWLKYKYTQPKRLLGKLVPAGTFHTKEHTNDSIRRHQKNHGSRIAQTQSCC